MLCIATSTAVYTVNGSVVEMFGIFKLRSTAARLSLGLVALTLSVISMAQVLGIFPDTTGVIIDGRLSLCKAIGIHCAAAVQKGIDIDSLNAVTSSMVSQNDAVLSIAIVDAEGKTLIQSGDHETLWRLAPPKDSTSDFVRIPIFRGAKPWGTIQICFEPMHGGVMGWLKHPVIGTMLFMGLVGFIVFALYLRRTLKILNPQAVIPERIQAMLNALTEGVAVLDKSEQIVLANDAFAKHVGISTDKLQGKLLSSLPWKLMGQEESEEQEAFVFPWKHAIEKGETKIGVPLKITTSDQGVRTMMVNAAPIHGGDGGTRGALTTFDDVTKVEQKNVQLNEMVGMLKKSRDQISEQNKELKRLATRDPLTNLFNRRSLFEQFDSLWRIAEKKGKDLGCIMFDIDRFKSINDTHGHAIGDQVLREIAEVLRTTVDEMDVVARYGGEEFCVLLRYGGMAEAETLAERIRVAIEARHCADLDVTSSFGASGKANGAKSTKELLEEADQALYAAKHGGRNRVVRWDQIADVADEVAAAEEQQETPASSSTKSEPEPLFIPYQAVTGLVASLTQRDAGTGQHSKRVADLCVLVGSDLMSPRELFVLEVAALLHDLGKLGIPDSILLKPGRLTDEEYAVMQLHDEMGVSIVSATFDCPELTRIVETHHAWFGGNDNRPDLPSSTDIPLPARILTIADAFDAMVSDRPYHTGRSDEKALAELRRCAGTQFDPELVDHFIEVIPPHRAGEKTGGTTASSELAVPLDQAIEQLAKAFKAQEISLLPLLAGHLKIAAARRGLGRIVQLASELEQVETESDLVEMTKLVKGLLEICESCEPDPGTSTETKDVGDAVQESNEKEDSDA